MSIENSNLPPVTDAPEHLIRQRINAILANAAQKPLVIICTGAGCGKTWAVYDFIGEKKIAAVWVRLSENDNSAARFWEDFVHGIEQADGFPADNMKELGFPDTDDKMSRYFAFRDRSRAAFTHPKYLTVIDDLHLIHNQSIITFIERLAHGAQPGDTLILISRQMPQIDIADLQKKGNVSIIQEDELNFTENELSQYLGKQNVRVGPQVLHEINQDINGWAFSVDLVADSLRKSPGYAGYARNAIRKNIFEFMEAGVYSAVSAPLRRFLVRLSLVEHLSAELIDILAAGDEALLSEFKRQNAYIRYDGYMDAYLIHPLLVDFLRTKQNFLTEDEKRETYRVTAEWCNQNAFAIDALDYYEKIGDYASITSIFFQCFSYVPSDFASYAVGVFERAPSETFDRVDFFAAAHLYFVQYTGRWRKFFALAQNYIKRFQNLPEDNILRNHTLSAIYCCVGLARNFLCTVDDRYDSDIYFAKMAGYFHRAPMHFERMLNSSFGAWVSLAGSARQGAPREFIESTARAYPYISSCIYGAMDGAVDLCSAELEFYQGNIQAAKSYIFFALAHAKNSRQYEVTHRALFYTMRIAVMQGNYEAAEKAIRDIEALIDEQEYSARFITCDIALGWYYYILRQPDNIPGWLKEGFAPYGHAYFMDNFGNQVKARYLYLMKNYLPLLAYIDDMKQRESILYGRIEMLAMEACVRYQMRDKKEAFAMLRRAYEAASPNQILTPFVELGKDMRTLTIAAMCEPDCGIESRWLETVNKKASLYARYQAMIVSKYKKNIDVSNWDALSPREAQVLHDLYNGLSHAAIATNQGLSISTVKMNINSIKSKLSAQNMTDIVRIACERKLV